MATTGKMLRDWVRSKHCFLVEEVECRRGALLSCLEYCAQRSRRSNCVVGSDMYTCLACRRASSISKHCIFLRLHEYYHHVDLSVRSRHREKLMYSSNKVYSPPYVTCIPALTFGLRAPNQLCSSLIQTNTFDQPHHLVFATKTVTPYKQGKRCQTEACSH